MRPDPWQREKSKRYQARRRARGLEVKTSKKDADTKVKSESTVVDGGFKFVNPMPAPQPQLRHEGTDEEDEDEYDVAGLEDVGFDFSSLSLQGIYGPDDYFSAEELRELDEAVGLEIPGVEKMSKWLQQRLQGESEYLLRLEPISASKDICADSHGNTEGPATPQTYVSSVTEVARPRTDPLEDMLDDLLDT